MDCSERLKHCDATLLHIISVSALVIYAPINLFSSPIKYSICKYQIVPMYIAISVRNIKQASIAQASSCTCIENSLLLAQNFPP